MRTDLFIAALIACTTMFLTSHAADGSENKFTAGILVTAPVCQKLLDEHEKYQEPGSGPAGTYKPADISKIIAELRAVPIPGEEDFKKLHQTALAAKTFKDLTKAYVDILASQCVHARITILRTLLKTQLKHKLTAKQKEQIAAIVRQHWLSSLNLSNLGLRINSGFALQICKQKMERQFGLKCDGLPDFITKMRRANREAQRESLRIRSTFTFAGRLRFYWDKWVLRKPEKEMVIDLDRYFDPEPSKKRVAEEHERNQALRAEFEAFVQ